MKTKAKLPITFGVLISAFGCPTPADEVCEHLGETYQIGDTVPSEDCTSCLCTEGPTVVCEVVSCDAADAGPGGATDGGALPDADAGGQSPDGGTPPFTDAGVETESRPPYCVDQDQDGFFACVGDGWSEPCECNDANHPEIVEAIDCDDERFFIQPGGYEYPDNGFDDNCDGLTDAEESPPCACEVGGFIGSQLIGAMDLCDESLVSVSTLGNALQYEVFGNYFDDVVPQNGECLTVLSTGEARATTVGIGSADLCGSDFFPCLAEGCVGDPAPENPGTGVCDLAQLQLTLAPPRNAKGFEVDFMFLSAEWPEFLCQDYNDTFYALLESQAVNEGRLTNISFDPEEREITVNVGFFEAPRNWTVPLDQTPFGAGTQNSNCGFPSVEECTLPGYCPDAAFCEPACPQDEYCVDLGGTGEYQCRPGEEVDLGHEGSGSGWLVTRAPISPQDETITLTFSIHDEGDGIFDSLVIIDNFRWVPYEPPVSTVPKF